MTHHHDDDDDLKPGIVNGQSPMPYIDRVYDEVAHQLPQHVDDLIGIATAAGALYGEGLADTLRRVAARFASTTHAAHSDLVHARRDHDDEVTRLTERLALAEQTRSILETGITDARTELATVRDAASTIRSDVEDLRLVTVGPTGAIINRILETIDRATRPADEADQPVLPE